MNRTPRFWIAILTVCVSLFGAALASAQDPTATPVPVKATPVPTEIEAEATAEAAVEATPESTETPITHLTYNEPVSGRIDNDSPAQDWPLPLTSADRLHIIVERVDGNLIPNVLLLDATGSQVSSSFGAQPDGATAIIENVTAATAGDFTVRVERDRGADGLTEGAYTLTVIPLAAAADAAPNTDIVGAVNYDAPVEGEITPEHWYQRYTLAAEAADSIQVRVERTSGSLEPVVFVIGPDGSNLASGYTEGTGDVAGTNRVNLPAAGEYTIAVTRAQEFNGPTTGGYRLTVRLIGAGPGSASLARSAGDVVYDEPLEGEITAAQWYQDWTLTADAGDTLNLNVVRANDANLQPEVILLGGSGQEIAHGYTANTGDRASIDRRTLDGPGTYTVRVSRRNGQTGETTGAYTLTVELVGSGEGSPELQGVTGSIAVGETVEGEVTNTRWADSWTLSATADERILVTAQRAGGTLIPRVQVRDRNGQVLSDGYPEPTGDIATLRYNPPATGEYLIVVMRDREQQGVTTGRYTLTVTPVE